jgi:hypothetical protein
MEAESASYELCPSAARLSAQALEQSQHFLGILFRFLQICRFFLHSRILRSKTLIEWVIESGI